MKKTKILLLPFLIFGMALAGCKKSSSKEVAVTGISLDRSSLEVEVDKTATLVATVKPDNATNKTVTWVSSDTAIATVSGGTVTGKSVGDAVITATAGKYSATCALTVKAASTVTTYTVTFDSDGGSAVASQTVNEGEKATKPTDPTKDGYTFEGWFNGETEFDFNTAITANITLKAHWEQNAPADVYTVKFGTNEAITLVEVDKAQDDAANMIHKFKGTSNVTAGQTISFILNGEAIKPGDENKEGEDHNGNNTAGTYADGYTVHNDAANADVYLKVYDNGEQGIGYSFWLTGYVEDSDPGTTVPDYVVHLSSGEEWSDEAMTADSEENPTEYHVFGLALKVNDVFKIHMKDSDTKADWRGYSDLKLSAESQANFEEAATDDNIKVKVAGTYDIYVKVEADKTGDYVGKSIWIEKKAEIVPVTSVTVSLETLSLETGKHSSLTATVAPDNASDKKVVWSVTSGSDYASVDENGQITAIAVGTAVIRATSHADETKYDECTVTITAPKTIDEISAVYSGGVIYVGEKLNGEALELKKIYDDDSEAAFDDEDLGNLHVYRDAELEHEVLDFENYVFVAGDTSLSAIYIKLGEHVTHFDVTVQQPVYSYKVNDSDPVALVDDSDADKDEDTWDNQYKATLNVALGDVITFIYGRNTLDVGAGSFAGNNVRYVESDKTLIVRHDKNDADLFLKIYDHGEDGLGYSSWLTGYVEEPTKLVFGDESVVTLEKSGEEWVKLDVNLTANSTFVIKDGENLVLDLPIDEYAPEGYITLNTETHTYTVVQGFRADIYVKAESLYFGIHQDPYKVNIGANEVVLTKDGNEWKGVLDLHNGDTFTIKDTTGTAVGLTIEGWSFGGASAEATDYEAYVTLSGTTYTVHQDVKVDIAAKETTVYFGIHQDPYTVEIGSDVIELNDGGTEWTGVLDLHDGDTFVIKNSSGVAQELTIEGWSLGGESAEATDYAAYITLSGTTYTVHQDVKVDIYAKETTVYFGFHVNPFSLYFSAENSVELTQAAGEWKVLSLELHEGDTFDIKDSNGASVTYAIDGWSFGGDSASATVYEAYLSLTGSTFTVLQDVTVDIYVKPNSSQVYFGISA